ncbi:hypothetical protein B0J12DRAFT_223692 [Macrophomina phaseolina]|uniref:Uncharacterized protein n=1 Tax=Macrophomina phaseolina TaxID=35725 RepID=A0ABQ8G3I4_9PEZI|nr:hypothetical protein B0J12DRAFT_223692 [Macrophomina phaseolina]
MSLRRESAQTRAVRRRCSAFYLITCGARGTLPPRHGEGSDRPPLASWSHRWHGDARVWRSNFPSLRAWVSDGTEWAAWLTHDTRSMEAAGPSVARIESVRHAQTQRAPARQTPNASLHAAPPLVTRASLIAPPACGRGPPLLSACIEASSLDAACATRLNQRLVAGKSNLVLPA